MDFGGGGLINPLMLLEKKSFGEIPLTLSTTLGLFLFSGGSQAAWNRITLTGMTGGWYIPLSGFEASILIVLFIPIIVLRYIEILPITYSSNFAPGRKRRSSRFKNPNDPSFEINNLANQLLSILRRLDKEDCGLKTICELQSASANGYKVSKDMKLTLLALKRSGQRRKKAYLATANNVTIEERPVISAYEEAVEIGIEQSHKILNYNFKNDSFIYSNSSYFWKDNNDNDKNNEENNCGTFYALCPLSSDDILFYIDKIKQADFL